jgi:hypothetical protein
MSREVRLLWLHSHLSKDDATSLDDFIKKFGISSRQATRDLKYLKKNLGAPLSYNREKSGYTYTHPYEIPSLFSESFSKQIVSKGEVRNTILKAIEEKRVVRVILNDSKSLYFHPVCYDERRNVFAGTTDKNGFLLLDISDIHEIRRSRRLYFMEPMLWNKNFSLDMEMKEVMFQKEDSIVTYHYLLLDDLILFVLKNRDMKLVGPAEVLKEVAGVAKTLNEVVGEKIED